MRQSEVRVRAGVEAWHLVKVHWLEYRFRVLWADFTFFLDTGSTQREARHSNLQLRALRHRQLALSTKNSGKKR